MKSTGIINGCSRKALTCDSEFMKKLDTSSPENFAAYIGNSIARSFYNDVIGQFDEPVLPLNARTRKTYDTDP